MAKLKRIGSILLAAIVMIVTMATSFATLNVYADETNTLTINGVGQAEHTFELYQIMTGTYTQGQPSDMKWGNGITSYTIKNTYTNAGYTEGQVYSVTAGSVVDPLLLHEIAETGELKTDKTELIGRITVNETNKTTKTSSNGTVTFTALETGYYLVKDVTQNVTGDDSVSGDILIYVSGNTTSNVKTVKPEFHKSVSTDGTNSTTEDNWSSVADYNIGDKVYFRLQAEIPQTEDLKAFETYKLVLTDNYSEGITFGEIESVTLKTGANLENSTTINAYAAGSEENGYKLVKTPGEDDQTGFTLELTDLRKNVSEESWGLAEGEIVITVIYSGTLNEKAPSITQTTNDASYTAKTQLTVNSASMTYSNNSSDATATGTTATDNVGIFTYKMSNTKYANLAQTGYELNGAKFTLYRDSVSNENKVKVIYDATLNAYRPVIGVESEVENMITGYGKDDGGKLDIVGLDQGTYVLVEDEAPDGYTKINDLTFTIASVLAELRDATGATATITVTGIDALSGNKLIDTLSSNRPLPSTGGIGTTIFYIVGSILIIGGGVILILRKRIATE